MITREQVTALHLRPGDVVRVTGWDGLTAEGPVSRGNADGESLWLGGHIRLNFALEPSVPPWMERPDATITVVSRAPRPLYVNHPRTEPVPGDVVRDADRDHPGIWVRSRYSWVTVDGDQPEEWQHAAPNRLRLLVDGETGQAVPS